MWLSLCSLGSALCCILRLSGPLKQQYAQVGWTPADTTAALLHPTHPCSASPSGTRAGSGPATEFWPIQGAVSGQHDSLGGNSSIHRPRILLSLSNHRSMATSLGMLSVLLLLATQACFLVVTNIAVLHVLRWWVMHGASQTCSGSGQNSHNKRRVWEFDVQTKHGSREGGTLPQVRAVFAVELNESDEAKQLFWMLNVVQPFASFITGISDDSHSTHFLVCLRCWRLGVRVRVGRGTRVWLDHQ